MGLAGPAERVPLEKGFQWSLGFTPDYSNRDMAAFATADAP